MKNNLKYISFLLFFICMTLVLPFKINAEKCSAYIIEGDELEKVDFSKLKKMYSIFNELLSVDYVQLELSTGDNENSAIYNISSFATTGTYIHKEGYYIKEEKLWQTDNFKTIASNCPILIAVRILPNNEPSATTINLNLYNSLEEAYEYAWANYDLVFRSNVGEEATNCLNDHYKENDELDNLVSKISNIDELNLYLENPSEMPDFDKFVKNLGYFSGDCSNVRSMISRDQERLDKLKTGDLANCLNDKLGTSGAEGLKQYSLYKGSFNGKYVDALDILYTVLLESDNLNSICESNRENDVKDYIREKDCKNIPVTSDMENCIEENFRDDVEKIDCKKLYSIQYSDEATPVEKYVAKQISNSCNGISDSTAYSICFYQKCEGKKEELSGNAEAFAEGKTENQQEAKQVLDGLRVTWVEHDSVEVVDDLCKLLKSEFFNYINGGLNLIKVIGPILVLLLTMFEGIKTFTSFKEEAQKKFFSRLTTRLICVALLFLVPTLVRFLLNIITEQACTEIL